jgi:hypothetical protein
LVVFLLCIYYSSHFRGLGAAMGGASDERRAERRRRALSARGADHAGTAERN